MKEQINKIMSRVFAMEVIPDGISTETCEKWDSLHHLTLIVELEMAFDIEFEPEEIGQMKSLDKIIELIKQKQ